MNQIRSLLLERGHVTPQGKAKLSARLNGLLEEETSPLTQRMQLLTREMREEWRSLDQRIGAVDAEFAAQARKDARMSRLLSIPGIGALNATALVAGIGDASAFARGRDLAAWLGLVPRQGTTGGKPRLRGTTKRGNSICERCLSRALDQPYRFSPRTPPG